MWLRCAPQHWRRCRAAAPHSPWVPKTAPRSEGSTVHGSRRSRATPTVVDLFCGAGGFSLGFERAGFETNVGIEADQRAADAFNLNFPRARVLCEDISRLTGPEVLAAAGATSCDVVIGGPPCQGFSIAGHMNPDDDRRGLISEFARLVDELWPDYFVMENVPGILAASAEPALADFRGSLESAGYEVGDPWVLSATDFGVPQARKRVFFVGARSGLMMPTVPEPRCDVPVTSAEAIEDLREDLVRSSVAVSDYARSMRGSEPPRTLDQITGCEHARHTEETVRRFSAVAPGKVESISRFRRLHPDQPAPTLRAGTSSDRGRHTAARPIHYAIPRCITVRESARLQSIPDQFQFDRTKWRGLMQVGNAVPPLLGEAVAQSLLEAMNSRR